MPTRAVRNQILWGVGFLGVVLCFLLQSVIVAQAKDDQSSPTIKTGYPSSTQRTCRHRSMSGLELGYYLLALAGAWFIFLSLHDHGCME